LKTFHKMLMGVFLVFSSCTVVAQSLDITIHNIRNIRGTLILAFFKDDTSYQENKPFLVKQFSKHAVENKSLSVSLSIPEGLYGIALLDDENTNNKMDFNWIGLPKEGVGFSDFDPRGFKKPDFSDFDFILIGPDRRIQIVVRYF
jgi:uncharacterized protein (DUF2141 family)